MKTFYPNILSFAAAWAIRLLLILIGMTLAVRFFAQSDCEFTFNANFDNPTIDCSAPVPAFAPFEASSTCCEGPVNLSYFQSQGTSFVESCAVTTAMGPGPDWAVWLPNLPGGLTQYWHFTGSPTWQSFNDGTAHLQGVIAMQGNSSNQFALDIWFQNGKNWADWSALGRQYKDDLGLGADHHFDWLYYEMATNFATLTGLGALSGSQLELTHQPSNYYYGFQTGVGANNRNGNQGMSGWFYYNGVVNGQSATGHGDINVDSSCENGEGCANTIQTLVARAEDACGNVAFSSQSITIVDATAPVVDPFESIISMDCENYEGVFITATDNCSEVSITYTDLSEGPCAAVTRTYLISDGCGNTTTAEQTIVLNAGEPPMFTVFPSTLIVECDQADAIPTPEVLWQVGCGGEELTITTITEQGLCPNTYTTYNTYIVTDNCGGSDTAVWVIEVVDTTAPVLYNVPIDIEIFCGEEIPDINVFALDNCDQDVITSLSAETIWGTCGYDFIRTWTATDACGNTATASQTIHVDDVEKPNFSFVPSSVMLECGTPFELTIPTANDECSAVEMEWTDVDLEDCAGSYARIFRAFDGCGNSRLATVFVMFTDNEAPSMIEFPQDVFVTCSTLPSQDEINVAWQDNCGNVTVEVTEENVQGDCPGAYTIARTWELTDDCGNASAYTWNIHVTDEEAPELIGVPADMTIQCGEEIMEAVVQAIDDCQGNTQITLTAETIENPCGYDFVRTWTASDGCGNVTVASQTITVEDNTIPNFTYIPADINAACSDTELDGNEMAIATDECSNVVVTSFDTVLEGDCGNGVLRTFIATDGCGNVATADQIISYNDNFPPVFVFVSDDIQADCGDVIQIPAPIAEDECSEVVITSEDELLTACGGSFMRIYTATDGCGNTATASVEVVYNDGETPQITNGPADIEVSCDAIPSIESADIQFTDNCGNITLGQEEQRINGDCPGNYTLVRTYSLSDDCGNASEWVWTITVTDTSAPVIFGVPAGTSIGCGDEIPTADAFALDNCDEQPTLDLNAETIYNECGYDFIRTWTATDHCGNTTVQSQTISVTDDLPPFFTFVPADVNFVCGNTGDIEMATADDNCSLVSVTFEDEEIDALTGSFIRHWIATDGCGNVALEETLVTFDVNGPPAILCAGNQEIIGDANCSATLPDYTSEVWIETTCIDLTSLIITQVPAAGSIISADTDVTITVTNTDELSANCTFMVSLIDNTPPSLTCPAVESLILDENCSAILPNYTSLAGAADGCSSLVNVIQSPTPGTTLSGLTMITVELIAIDEAGNTTECSFGVELLDATSPYFTAFPEDSEVNCNQVPGAETAIVEYADNCGTVTVNFEEQIIASSDNCASNYQIIRTWTLTDGAGNAHAQTWTIDVVDSLSPILVGVPADMTIQCGDPIADAQVFATDECDSNVEVSILASTVELDCGYIFQRTWTATDDCGNTVTAVQNITIEDAVSPSFTFVPESAVIACESYNADLNNLPFAIAADDCSIVEVTFEDIFNDDCSGSFVRNWTATDGCGNTTTAQTNYTVLDLNAPVFTMVPNDLTVDGCNALPEATMDQIAYTENCSSVTLTVADEAFELDCPSNQLIYRVWRLTDGCGNQSSYTQQIFVIDETGPEIFGVPANEVLTCGETPAEAAVTAIDNCSDPENINISLHAKTTQLECGNIFVRVWTATDECGNTSIATQEITYIDGDAPVFTSVPADYVVACGQEFILENATAVDECSLLSMQIIEGEPSCSGSYVRTFIATDGCGNSAVAEQLVTIVDDTAPSASSFVDVISGTCDEAPFIDISYVTFSDNCSAVDVLWSADTTFLCGGSYDVLFTWLAVDGCGNTANAFVNLEVVDLDGPSFDQIPADVTLACGATEPAPIISAGDGCGSAYLEFSEEVNDLGCGYQIERTWYAFDDCGNLATHVQYINFVDELAPTFVDAPEDLVLECSEIIPTPSLVLGMDDCQGLLVATMTSETVIPGTCNSNYQLERTYTLTDACGNTSEHIQLITVQDTQSPIFFDFNPSIEVSCTQSNGVFATAFDECSSIGVSYSDDLIGSGCTGQIQRTYLATDACGNSQEAVQLISLNDNTAPFFNVFPSDVSADCSSVPAPETATITFGDNCSNPSIDMVQTQEPGSCANEYLILRNYTLTDACGNQTTQTWTITVQDLTAPEILGVPTESYIECGDAVPSINAIAFDNCDGEPTLSVSAVTVPTASGCGSMFIRTWVASDACNNETTVSHTTYITDTTGPVLSGSPANVFVPCGAELPAAQVITAMDLCDGEVEVVYEESSFIGTCVNVTREWCATDCAGNQTCHVQTIFRTTTPALASGPQIAVLNSDRHHLNISVLASSEGRWNLEVFDMGGRKVTNLFTQEMVGGQRHTFELDCAGFNDSMYLLRWSNGQEQALQKVVMMK